MAGRGLQVALALAVAITLASCSEEEAKTNAAGKPVSLASYLPADSQMVQAVDIAAARKELKLPEDANALPISDKALPRPKSPEANLFQVTSRAYPDLSNVFMSELDGKGGTPLDGSLIRAAAGSEAVSVVSTSEPLEDIERKLELADYTLKGKYFVAGRETPVGASHFVVDAGSGRYVFARSKGDAAEVLRRITNEAKPGEAAKALERASGSVRLAYSDAPKRSCVTAFAVDQEATGEGAALALIIEGEKPEPERFDPKALKGVATGTPTVLVDALLVPFNVKKPSKDGLDPITQIISVSQTTETGPDGEKAVVKGPKRLVPAPFNAYDCP